jgi:hypothetical protein
VKKLAIYATLVPWRLLVFSVHMLLLVGASVVVAGIAAGLLAVGLGF